MISTLHKDWLGIICQNTFHLNLNALYSQQYILLASPDVHDHDFLNWPLC